MDLNDFLLNIDTIFYGRRTNRINNDGRNHAYPQNGLSDETYQKATEFFSEEQIAQIIMTIATINAWNRVAVSTHLQIGEF